MNSLSSLDLILVSSYLFFTLVLSIYLSRNSIRNIDNYFKTESQMPWWLLGTSMVATTLSIDTPIVIIGWINDPGIWKNWFWWSFLFTHCIVIFYFSKYWRRIGVLTDNELINFRYSGTASKGLRLFKAFYFSTFFNLIISAWIITAFVKIFTILIGDNVYLLLGISTFIAMFYTTISGLKGVMINDFIQYFIAFTGSILLAIFIINSEIIGGLGNYFHLIKELPKANLNIIPDLLNTDDFMTFLAYISLVWWTSHNSDGGGYIIQRLCSAKTERDGVLGTIWFVINHYVLRFIPWVFIGFGSLILINEFPSNTDTEQIFPILVRDYLGSGFKGIMIISLIAAYMSTISTQVNWGSSYLVNDIYKHYFKNSSEKKLVFISRVFSVVFFALAFLTAFLIKDVGKAWIFLWSVSSGLGFFLIARWFYWRINAWSEISAISVSIFITIIFFALDSYEIYSPTFFDKLLIIPISVTCGLVVTFITKPTDESVLKNFFLKVKPAGFWGPYGRDKVKKIDLKNILYAFLFPFGILLLIFSIIKFATGEIYLATPLSLMGLTIAGYIFFDLYSER